MGFFDFLTEKKTRKMVSIKGETFDGRLLTAKVDLAYPEDVSISQFKSEIIDYLAEQGYPKLKNIEILSGI